MSMAMTPPPDLYGLAGSSMKGPGGGPGGDPPFWQHGWKLLSQCQANSYVFKNDNRKTLHQRLWTHKNPFSNAVKPVNVVLDDKDVAFSDHNREALSKICDEVEQGRIAPQTAHLQEAAHWLSNSAQNALRILGTGAFRHQQMRLGKGDPEIQIDFSGLAFTLLGTFMNTAGSMGAASARNHDQKMGRPSKYEPQDWTKK